LEGYVLYIRDGKIQSTNVISIYFPVIPQWGIFTRFFSEKGYITKEEFLEMMNVVNLEIGKMV
jgi:hypothetical protein